MPIPAARLRPLSGLCLGALLLLLLPAAPLQAATRDPCAGLEAGGRYRNPTEHADGRYRLRRDGTRVTATLTTTSSPVYHRDREGPPPLFTIPEAFRPPRPVLLTAEGMAVRRDGTPDPAPPEPRRVGLWVDPDGTVHYADDTRVEGAGYLAYTLHTVWNAAPATPDPCPVLEAEGAYLNRAEHEGGRYRLRRDGTRVTATLTVDRSPRSGAAAAPLFTVPAPFRPPYPILRSAEGTPVLADGTPDPDRPEPRRFLLRVEPDGHVRYADEADVEDAGYLAYSLHTVWGTTPAANDRAVLEILDAHWFGETLLSAVLPPELFEVPARKIGFGAYEIGFEEAETLPAASLGAFVTFDADGRVTALGTPTRAIGPYAQLGPYAESSGYLFYFQTQRIAGSRTRVYTDSPGFHFHGPLLPELGQLHRLEHLDLGYRQAEAFPAGQTRREIAAIFLDRNESFPADMGALTGAIPPQLGQLTRLRYLDLQGQLLAGPLPPEMGDLASLEHLDLGSNWLAGSLPPELGQLARLRTLNLSVNRLTALPPELGQLTNLQNLDLSVNRLTALPPELGQLANLRTLNLGARPHALHFRGNRSNRLTALPPELGQLTNLRTLDLDGNELTALPPELGQLANLQNLDLGGNELTALPPELGQLANLQNLDLGGNELTALPPELGQFTNLRTLDLGRNELTALPPELGQLANLQRLRLEDNQLTGPLPPEWGQLASLELLNLGNNQLTGPLPPEWGQLASLELLNLGNNQLTGPLPPGWGQLASLELLYLYNNQLTGSLPPAWGQLASLVKLRLEDNQLTGPLPLAWTRMSNLRTLDTSSNQMTGCFPGIYFPNLKTSETGYIYVSTGLPRCPSLDYIYREPVRG